MTERFRLEIRDASTGCNMEPHDVDPHSTVGDFKALLRREKPDTLGRALRIHLAHRGRLLADSESLQILRQAPVIVVAKVMPAPEPTTPQPPPTIEPPARLQPFVALDLPRRAAVAHAWDRAFPGTTRRAEEAAGPATPVPNVLDGTDTAPGIAHEPIHAEGDDGNERLCRVCFCGEEAGRLIAPCRCRGSVRYVHAQCLNEWRVASANPRSFERCETCGFAYRTQRTALAEWLQDERVVLVATVVGLLLVVLAGAVLPFHPERQLYALIRWEPSISSLTAEWWGASCDAAVRGLFLPAFGGLVARIHTEYTRHRGMPLEQQTWWMVLVVSIADAGGIVGRPLLVGGFLYFVTQLFAHIRTRCRQMFTRFGERVLDLNLDDVRG